MEGGREGKCERETMALYVTLAASEIRSVEPLPQQTLNYSVVAGSSTCPRKSLIGTLRTRVNG